MDSAKKSPLERSIKTNVHPSVIFKSEVMDANGLSISMTANLLDVPELKVSNILNQKEDITPAIAKKIALAFGGNADFWVRMQKGYNSMNKTI